MRLTCPEGPVLVVSPAGEIDMATGPGLADGLLGAIAEGPSHLVVDLSAVDFFDSAGLHVMQRMARAASDARVAMVVCGAQPRVRKLFQITTTEDLFVFRSTADEALQILGAT